MFKRVLIPAWTIFFIMMLLFISFPRQAIRIPHITFIRPYMFALTIVSVVYGVVWLYRQGMNQTRRE